MNKNVLSVKQLNFYVKNLLEGDVNLVNVYVCGEISNFKNHYSSGHLYFSLKDDSALIRAVMFRQNAAYLKFVPEEGMKVICRGRVSVYDKDGQYQLYVESIEPDGKGSLSVAFEQLKQKLNSEGLFDASHKRKIPRFPQKIAVVTSDTSAALQDILNIIKRRYPCVNLTVCNATVQGTTGAASVISALEKAKKINPDTVIIARGGGSIEDLWCFNDETLARVIYEFELPIISAVGHETDFTICDFVSDLRAPTPSAAAELAVPDINDINNYILQCKNRLKLSVTGLLNEKSAACNRLGKSTALQKPIFADLKLYDVDNLTNGLNKTFVNALLSCENRYTKAISALDALSPLKVLNRGYSFALKDNKCISSVKDLKINDEVKVLTANGSFSAIVNDIEENL